MDATFWTLIALLLFLAVLYYLKIPKKISIFLDSHSEKIASELEQARLMREEAQKLLADFQKKRKEKEKEAAEIINAAKETSDAILKDAQEKIEEFVLRYTALAEKKIALAEHSAIEELKKTIIDCAIEKAKEKLL